MDTYIHILGGLDDLLLGELAQTLDDILPCLRVTLQPKQTDDA